MNKLPKKALERLSLYRRLLGKELSRGRAHIYSHELAEISNFTPAQVRRDLMILDHIGNPRRGYNISNLIEEISQVLKVEEVRKVALLGVGNLGRAALTYYQTRNSNTPIVAAFDVDSEKIGRVIGGCRCYGLDQLEEIVRSERIRIAIITVPMERAQEVTNRLIAVGVNSFVNFAPTPLKVPPNVYVDDIDISVAIDIAAYFARIED